MTMKVEFIIINNYLLKYIHIIYMLLYFRLQ